jgi:FADH2 O2-dependent halogenase
MFYATEDALNKCRSGELDEEQAEMAMLEVLQSQEWLPNHLYDWGNKTSRHVDFSKLELVGSLLQWGMVDSPVHIRRGLFDFELPPA